MKKRVFNFSAGPAVLPESVLERVSQGVLEIAGSGMSILEVSHRGAEYEAIHFSAMKRLLRLMNLSEQEHSVLFLGGGASLQFAMLPMAFLSGKKAQYVHTGEWSKKAFQEAKRFGSVDSTSASSEAQKFAKLPQIGPVVSDLAYLHLTTNNTIEGTQFQSFPETGGVPLVADASSDFLALERPWSKLSCVYAGAQKNLGPAGVTAVVMKKSFLEQASEDVPAILSYKNHAKADSLYNTPPAFSIYALGLVLEWIEEQGGVAAVEKQNRKKAGLVYDVLDRYPEIYDPAVVEKKDRSIVNLTFRLKNTDQEKVFLSGAEERKLMGLKGHRSVGGFRASMYNAFPMAGAECLAQYLDDFAKRR